MRVEIERSSSFWPVLNSLGKKTIIFRISSFVNFSISQEYGLSEKMFHTSPIIAAEDDAVFSSSPNLNGNYTMSDFCTIYYIQV